MVVANFPLYRRFVGRTPAQIMSGRRIMPPLTPARDLIDIIQEARPEDAIMLSEEFAVKGVKAHRFKRHGDVLRITPETSAHEAIASSLNPIRAIPEAFGKNDSVHRGYGWIGRGRSLRVVPLLYAVEGAELAVLEKNNIEVKRYNKRLTATVPSRSEKEMHTVILGGVPFQELGERIFAEWVHLRSRSTVEAQQWYGDLAQDRANDELLFTPQDIAAYHTAVARFPQDARPAINPFVIPTPGLASYVEKLRNNVVVLYKKENGEREKRNLNGTEKELLIWERTLYHPDTFAVDNTQYTLEHADYLVKTEA